MGSFAPTAGEPCPEGRFRWESEACLVAFEGSQVYRDLMARLAFVSTGPPDGDRCQVAARAGVAEPVPA